MTQEQKRAIKRICKDYDFENIKDLRAYFVDRFGDALDLDLWAKDENENLILNGIQLDLTKSLSKSLLVISIKDNLNISSFITFTNFKLS